jgi:hypothetical protein
LPEDKKSDPIYAATLEMLKDPAKVQQMRDLIRKFGEIQLPNVTPDAWREYLAWQESLMDKHEQSEKRLQELKKRWAETLEKLPDQLAAEFRKELELALNEY